MKSLYFHVGHRDLIGGGQLALYHLAVALQSQFDVYLSSDWNLAMAGYEFLVEPAREWKIGKPDAIDVFLCSEYVRNHHPIGTHNVQYTFFPRHRWDVSGFQWVVAISEYSRRYVHAHWRRDDAKILCGGVFADHYDYDPTRDGPKRPMILNTSRFFMEGDPERLVGHSKNQHVLIRAFRHAWRAMGEPAWELHLVGSVLTEEDRRYLTSCQRLADGAPVFFYPMLGREETRVLYRQASVFAHAMGYGRPDPAETEHYGFCVEKAVLCGALPIVHASGGAPEFGGRTFRTEPELVTRFADVMREPVTAPRAVLGRTFAEFRAQVQAMFAPVA